MRRAFGFDLGETLMHYPGTPLSWEALYPEALAAVAAACGVPAAGDRLTAAAAVLLRYNTRVNPRVVEVTAGRIFGEILARWQLPPGLVPAAVAAFFTFFQRDAAVYADAVPLLQLMRRRGMRVGILTDAPYGMPRELVERDIAPLREHIDALVTSVEAGYRKPDPRGYLELARRLGVAPADMVYTGNEPKDVEGARRAGCVPVLLDREGRAPTGDGPRIKSLTELEAWLEGEVP